MTGPNEKEYDALLALLRAPPARVGDRRFAAQVDRAIDAETALLSARRRFWRSFAVEATAIAALLAALWLLSSTPLLAPFAGAAHWGLASSLLLVLFLWFGGTQRLHRA